MAPLWPQKKNPAPAVGKNKKRILVIDDNSEMRKTLEVWLEMSGFEPLMGRGGRDGWNQAQYAKPDLVILDVRMPFLDGFSICRLMRSTEATKHIPIILLTGMDAMGDVEEGFKAGANDFVPKPFDWDRLHPKIIKLLGLPDPQKP